MDVRKDVYQSTVQVLIKQSSVDSSKTIGERLVDGSILDANDADLKLLNNDSVETSLVQPHILANLINLAETISDMLSDRELFRLNQILLDLEIKEGQQALRKNTFAKEMLRAEIKRHPENIPALKNFSSDNPNSSDQLHSTLISHILKIQLNQIEVNVKTSADLYNFIAFNLANAQADSESEKVQKEAAELQDEIKQKRLGNKEISTELQTKANEMTKKAMQAAAFVQTAMKINMQKASKPFQEFLDEKATQNPNEVLSHLDDTISNQGNDLRTRLKNVVERENPCKLKKEKSRKVKKEPGLEKANSAKSKTTILPDSEEDKNARAKLSTLKSIVSCPVWDRLFKPYHVVGEIYTVLPSTPDAIKIMREHINNNADSPESRWNTIKAWTKTKLDEYATDKKAAEIEKHKSLGNDIPLRVKALLEAIDQDTMDQYKQTYDSFLNLESGKVSPEKKSPRKD